jgi:flagellar biosynthesis protein FlhA
MLADSMGDHGLRFNLNPHMAQQLMEMTAQRMEEMAAAGFAPVLLCSATVRLAFKRLTERALPTVAILSYSEIASGINVQAQAMVDLPAEQSAGK